MPSEGPDIVVIDSRIGKAELARLVNRFFGDMVKIVVDIRKATVALGGELHADAEELLLQHGSRQSDLWGANYYPGLGEADCIEYTALINIRPSQENDGMEIEDDSVRQAVQRIIHQLIGRGEPL